MAGIFDWLRDPSIEGVNVDGEDRFVVHDKILKRKKIVW